MFAKKKPKIKDLNNPKGHDFVISLIPSQLWIVKSLVWIFKIISGKLSNAGIGAEALLEINRNKTNLNTRRQNRGIFKLSTERAEYHNEKLLILKRHIGYWAVKNLKKFSIWQIKHKKRLSKISLENKTPNRTRSGNSSNRRSTLKKHLKLNKIIKFLSRWV